MFFQKSCAPALRAGIASIAFVIPQRQDMTGEAPVTPHVEGETVRKRNVHIQLWLTEAEADRLNKKVASCGLTREAYLRQLISGYVPRQAPPVEYFHLTEQLRRIGTNMNQLARMANSRQWIDRERYEKDAEVLRAVLLYLTESVILPERMEDNHGHHIPVAGERTAGQNHPVCHEPGENGGT